MGDLKFDFGLFIFIYIFNKFYHFYRLSYNVYLK